MATVFSIITGIVVLWIFLNLLISFGVTLLVAIAALFDYYSK